MPQYVKLGGTYSIYWAFKMFNNPQISFERVEAVLINLTCLQDVSSWNSNPVQATLMTTFPGFFEPSRTVTANRHNLNRPRPHIFTHVIVSYLTSALGTTSLGYPMTFDGKGPR
jgi:hypothetical protein